MTLAFEGPLPAVSFPTSHIHAGLPTPARGCTPSHALWVPQVMQKPLDLDTIRCELPCQVDQVQLEVRELQGQVAELEKHLETSSKGNHSILCGQQQEVSAPVCIQGPSSEEVPGVPCRQQQEVSTQPVPKDSGENLFAPYLTLPAPPGCTPSLYPRPLWLGYP